MPLKLEGLTGSQALEKILAEGFRCDLEPVRPLVSYEPPLAECSKKPSGYGPLCEELLVTLRFERITPPPSREELLNMLDTIKVRTAAPFCP